MKLSDKQQVFTRNIGKLIAFATENGYGLTFGHAWRSIEEQQRLVKENKSQTLKSLHLQRLAVDFNVFLKGELTWRWPQIKPLGDYWEELHPENRWGGDWNHNKLQDGFIDVAHFEMG